MDVLAKLLRPRSVAVIGASADPTKTSGRPVSQLLKRNFSGAIYPVNPKVSRIAALTCYPNISSLPAVPDVAIVLLGAERAHQAVRELAAIGTGAAIVLASGYGEVGEEGARRQQQLIESAGSMRILGPNTIGLVNLTDSIVLSASGALETEHFAMGSIAIIAQSGGILGVLLSRAAARGIGLSKLVATGNEADLELADFLDHLAGDDATRVIALYIEAVRHPAKFRAAALKARGAGKPIIAFKIGRSEAGARAAVSHTGALAGSDRMYDALFKQLGIIRAQTFGDLLDIATGLATGRRLLGKRIAILTSTGGAGTLVADCLGAAGFDTPGVAYPPFPLPKAAPLCLQPCWKRNNGARRKYRCIPSRRSKLRICRPAHSMKSRPRRCSPASAFRLSRRGSFPIRRKRKPQPVRLAVASCSRFCRATSHTRPRSAALRPM
jgi:acyl-CoA synthetase (NDP forming)